MLYGVSKVITDNISLGDDYDKVRKVYSINIVYFTLGQAKDYVYHGKTMFQGLHQPNDILKLSNRQSELFFGDEIPQGRKTNREAGDIFPEYYLLCGNNFDKLAVNNLDEWIEFLKTGEISEAAQAPGLADARKCLDIDKLTVAEKNDYVRHMENLRYQRSVIKTGYDDGWQKGLADGREEGREEGRAEGRAEGREEGREEGRAEGAKDEKKATARRLLAMGLSAEQVAAATQLSLDEIKKL